MPDCYNQVHMTREHSVVWMSVKMSQIKSLMKASDLGKGTTELEKGGETNYKQNLPD